MLNNHKSKNRNWFQFGSVECVVNSSFSSFMFHKTEMITICVWGVHCVYVDKKERIIKFINGNDRSTVWSILYYPNDSGLMMTKRNVITTLKERATEQTKVIQPMKMVKKEVRVFFVYANDGKPFIIIIIIFRQTRQLQRQFVLNQDRRHRRRRSNSVAMIIKTSSRQLVQLQLDRRRNGHQMGYPNIGQIQIDWIYI